MTSAPASRARCRVASVLPPSATITRTTKSRGMARTTAPIEASSFNVGIATTTAPGCKGLKTPTQTAARARLRRAIRQQRFAERLVSRTVPDVAQARLRRVTQGVVLVTALREWRDAAGQGSSVGGDVHDGPWSAAEAPGRRLVAALETHAGLGRGTRGAESHAVAFRQPFGLRQRIGFIAVHLLVERLVGPRHTDGVVVKKHQTLQIDFLDADVGRDLHERRQLGDRLLQAGQPG